jgi:hypothetical protein
MPYCRKIADELLLGLLYDPQDLCCFPDIDFELLNDDDSEKFELGNPDALADISITPYMELIDINGNSRSLLSF